MDATGCDRSGEGHDAGRSLEELAEAARRGDREAAERLVLEIQDPVYGLAMRMLGRPDDAQDATQEILIKVLRHPNGFRGESAFQTWVWRIACNHLLRARAGQWERRASFEAVERLLDMGRGRNAERTPQHRLLAREVEVNCTQAMMLSLDRDHRLAFALGEVFELSSDEAAAVLEITPAAFRKRLSRARRRLRDFMLGRCGLARPENPCRCEGQVSALIEAGILDPGNPFLSTHPERGERTRAVADRIHEVEEIHRISFIFRNHPRYAAPESVRRALRELIESGRFELLS